jgi:archaellum component FlaC
MGKKKDKASKSKKKSKTDIVVEPESKIIEDIAAESEAIQDIESEAESIQYAEHVTAEDVMELINTLSQDLNKLEQSNQSLQQQIAQSQKAPQRQHTVLKIIAIILGIGIIAVGYSSAKINSRMNENTGTGIDSTDLDKMTSRITNMDTSIEAMSNDINKINTSLVKLSTDVTTINQNVNKVASDVNKIHTSTASTTQPNTRYMGRPMEPWPRW